MPHTRNDNSRRQNTIQKGLFAFVLVICSGLLLVPDPQAATPPLAGASPQTELGYGAPRIAVDGLQP